MSLNGEYDSTKRLIVNFGRKAAGRRTATVYARMYVLNGTASKTEEVLDKRP